MFRERLEGFGFAFAAFINSIWIFYIYLSVTLIGAFEPASFSRVLELTAERPYIYRILVPALSKLISSLISSNRIDWLNTTIEPLSNTFKRLSGGIYPREAAVALIIMFSSIMAFAIVERIFLADLGFNRKELFVFPLLTQMLILPVNMIAGYYYDLPQLLFMTIGLILLHRRHWTGYLAVLGISSLNKETAAFLIVVFCIYYWSRLPRKNFLHLLVSQGFIIVAIRISMMFLFRVNAGSSLVFTIPDQINIYSKHPLALVSTLACFGLITYLVFRNWRSKNEFLRASASIGLIIFLLFVPFGYPLEFRVFLEALPVIGILIFPSGFIKA